MSGDENLALGRMAELGLLTATLNHELRQPLFAVKSLAQIMSARPDAPPELAELLQQLTLMEGLVDGVSTYARHAPQTLAPLDPLAPVEQAVKLLRHRARRRRVRLETELLGEPPAVRGDPSAVMQALVNLVQNAIDASPAGTAVLVRVSHGEGLVWLDVLDEGPGIPLAYRERVFEAFYTTKAPGRGTGLGLAIARDLIRACDGALLLMEADIGAHMRVALKPWAS